MSTWFRELLARPDWWTQQRKRQALVAFLAFIGVVSFVEVVLIPGAILRHPPALAQAATRAVAVQTPVEDVETHPSLRLVESVLESGDTKRKREQERQAAIRHELKIRLHASEERLRKATDAAGRDWDAFVERVRRCHHVDLAAPVFDPSQQSHELDQLLITHKTAATAWSAIRRLPPQIVPVLREARSLLEDTDRAITADTFSEADAGPLATAIVTVQSAHTKISEATIDLNHIDVLLRIHRLESLTTERKTP
ncbi:MAG: hypothetical protein ABSH20_23490 [Tepidisphaeraceae bacterium]|jgi:hypothetical protein